jgi:NAD(P)-dependent dehydrogenase (short-subunit alcohol dehydrogenase family)
MISSASRAGTLLVVGSGPNIGVSTATLFAQKKFDRIALISRSSSRLQTDKSTILSYLSSSTIPSIQFQIETWAVDVTEKDKFEAVLEQVGEWSKAEDMGIGCILFNAARVDFSSICGGFEEKELVYDFMVTITLSLSMQFIFPALFLICFRITHTIVDNKS